MLVDDDRVRSATWQKILVAIVMHQPTIDGPSKSLPVALPATKLGILPGFLFRRFKSFPMEFVQVGGHLFDIFVHLSATHIADLQGFAHIEDLLVEKTAVHADDDRHIPTIVAFDLDHHVPDHIEHGIAMVGMFVATTKHRIDNETPPIHLQRLESLFLLVGGLDAIAAQGIVVVHDHRIDTQFDNRRSDDPQAPEKKRLQQSSEQKHSRPGKCLEEPLDLVGRGHVGAISFDTASIPFILTKLVEIGQPPTGTIDEKAQHLLEEFCNGQPLAVLADGTEPAIKPIENLNAVQVGDETEPGPLCQSTGRRWPRYVEF
jgi:hypothetical protein